MGRIKKKVKDIVIICVAICLLAGCTQELEPSVSETEFVIQSSLSASTDSAGETSTETTTETESATTESVMNRIDGATTDRGILLDEETLAEYQALFNEYATWYSQALTSVYSEPAEIDLKKLFYGGIFQDEAIPLTAQEEAFVKDLVGDSTHSLDTIRIPAYRMDQILKQYFGVTLEETEKKGLNRFYYFEETDCYYSYVSDTNVMKVSPHCGYLQEDGSIRLYYYDTEDPVYENTEYVVTIRLNDSHIQVISNCLAYFEEDNREYTYSSRETLDQISCVIAQYLNERREYLPEYADGFHKGPFTGTVSEVFEDEKNHREYLMQKGISYRFNGVEKMFIRLYEDSAVVELNEMAIYYIDGEGKDSTIKHIIELQEMEKEQWLIIKDRYSENISGFISCSFEK